MRQADEPGLPYHRVVASGGKLGGYTSLQLKAALLSAEGLVVRGRRIVKHQQHLWPSTRSDGRSRR
jgi:alkylated DNA nucleotide flippase Atl1